MDNQGPVLRQAKIRFGAPTYRYVKEAADIVGKDISEMARRLNHPAGRRGYRARGITSEIGIHKHPNETIRIILEKSEQGRTIYTEHHIGELRITVAVDNTVVITAPIVEEPGTIPESYKLALEGKPLSAMIDLSSSSVPEYNNFKIKSFYTRAEGYQKDRKLVVIYTIGDVYEYNAEILGRELTRLGNK